MYQPNEQIRKAKESDCMFVHSHGEYVQPNSRSNVSLARGTRVLHVAWVCILMLGIGLGKVLTAPIEQQQMEQASMTMLFEQGSLPEELCTGFMV
eukprot:6317830-Amphidinium_carterae.2